MHEWDALLCWSRSLFPFIDQLQLGRYNIMLAMQSDIHAVYSLENICGNFHYIPAQYGGYGLG
jgi:hypothetical protein